MAIHINPAHKGLLHKELGVAEGTTIPAKKLAEAKDSTNPAERRRAIFAENAKAWSHASKSKPHPNSGSVRPDAAKRRRAAPENEPDADDE